MIEQLITDHLGLWTSAARAKSSAGRGSNSKVELAGIKKLRELILELAVRGKLVPQDPDDEPASALLARIAAEKARLLKEGKIKKSKPLPEITDDEKPFELPDEWAVERLGNVINVLNGRAYKKHEMLDAGTPLLRVGNLFTSDEWYYSNLVLEPEKYIDNGDLIYSWSASFGPFIWAGGKVIYHYHIWKMDIYDGRSLDKFYMRLYLEAVSASIKASGNGIAMVHMTKERMEKLVIPIPPIIEQKRIVAKVDELMTLCDQLEQKSATALAAHQTLVETLLATLTDSADAAELAQNWARLATHFDMLFTTHASIDALKQTILQLAVMGKLVPQDPSDEPAAVLLARIAAEKARLIKEGKIKKEKPLPPISDEEKPFALPNGWEWGRLADMFQFLNGYAFKSEWFSPTGVRLLRNINISHGQTKWDDEVYLSYEHQYEYERFKLEVGDVVISLDRPIINSGLKYAIIRECDLPCLLLQRVAKFHSVGNLVSASFLPLWLESQAFMNAIDPGRSNGVPHISTKQLELTCFPILSLAEQQRIVSKVDEMMSLCDQLSARLQASQTTQLQLAEALVEGALN